MANSDHISLNMMVFIIYLIKILEMIKIDSVVEFNILIKQDKIKELREKVAKLSTLYKAELDKYLSNNNYQTPEYFSFLKYFGEMDIGDNGDINLEDYYRSWDDCEEIAVFFAQYCEDGDIEFVADDGDRNGFTIKDGKVYETIYEKKAGDLVEAEIPKIPQL